MNKIEKVNDLVPVNSDRRLKTTPGEWFKRCFDDTILNHFTEETKYKMKKPKTSLRGRKPKEVSSGDLWKLIILIIRKIAKGKEGDDTLKSFIRRKDRLFTDLSITFLERTISCISFNSTKLFSLLSTCWRKLVNIFGVVNVVGDETIIPGKIFHSPM